MQGAVESKQLRFFGLLVGGLFGVLGVWPVVFRGQGARLWALILAALLVIPAVLFPASLRQPHRVWMALGEALGWINTRIILGLVYYGLMTPMGVMMRLLGKDPMRRRFEPAVNTYRVPRPTRPSDHMDRQF
jgi:Saxitoxin biosynthesis operon protein SxtJ